MAEERSLYRVLRTIVLIFFFIPVVLLAAMALQSVCHITDRQTEIHYFVSSSPLPALAAFLAALGALIICRKTGAARFFSKNSKMLTLFLLLLLSVASVVYIRLAKVLPQADQLLVFQMAAHWRQQNFSDLLPGGYLDRYPQQIGLALVYYVVSFVIGNNFFTFWQLLNVAALAVGIWFFACTAEAVFPRKWMRPAVAAGCCLFLPLLFYTVFNYGTLYGFCASMAAFYLLTKFLQDGKPWQAAAMCLLAAFAVQLKQNYLISLVAMVVILVLDSIRRKKLFPLFGAAGLLAATLLFSKGAVWIVEAMSGLKVSSGVPKSLWIMMGLDSSFRAPGWYLESSAALYEKSGCNTAATDTAAKAAISARLSYFSAHPGYTVQFFIRKTASQWNEPTFQCFWITTVRRSFSNASPFIRNLLTGKTAFAMEAYLHVYETVILLGTLCCLIPGKRSAPTAQLLFPVTFVGGFLFHLFWEAKGQYTFLYFLLLLPFAVEGLTRLASLPYGVLRRKENRHMLLRRRWPQLLAAFLLAACLLASAPLLRQNCMLSSNDSIYAEYRAERLSS